MNLKSEIDLFVAEFSKIESQYVGEALRSMSADASFAAESERILDLDSRFTLLKRMALARNAPPALVSQLEAANVGAARLREKRDELARTMSSLQDPTRSKRRRYAPADYWIPTIDEIGKCRESAAMLQTTLTSIAREVANF